MAKDLEHEKNSPESSKKDKEDGSKMPGSAKKSKDSKDPKDLNNRKGKGKKKKSIVKYFKDARSEFKKVVWSTPKETTRNTIVVLVVCIFAALVIFGLDSLFGLLNRLLVQLG